MKDVLSYILACLGLLFLAFWFAGSNDFDPELSSVYYLSAVIFIVLAVPMQVVSIWFERILVSEEGVEDSSSSEIKFYKLLLWFIHFGLFVILVWIIVLGPSFKFLSQREGAEEGHRHSSLWAHFVYTLETKDARLTKERGADGGDELLAELRTIESQGLEPNYEELARFPDKYQGKPVKLVGEVVQELRQQTFRIDVTRKDYGWSDTILVKLRGNVPKVRILEGDEVLILGYADGLETYEGLLGQPVTLPRVRARSVSPLRDSRGEAVSNDSANTPTRLTPPPRAEQLVGNQVSQGNTSSTSTSIIKTSAGDISYRWEGDAFYGRMSLWMGGKRIYDGGDGHTRMSNEAFRLFKAVGGYEYRVFPLQDMGNSCEPHALLITTKEKATVHEIESCDSEEEKLSLLVLNGFEVSLRQVSVHHSCKAFAGNLPNNEELSTAVPIAFRNRDDNKIASALKNLRLSEGDIASWDGICWINSTFHGIKVKTKSGKEFQIIYRD